MTKKSKVIQADYLEKFEKKEGGFLYNHVIAFENGDKGKYTSQKEEQDKFVVGQEAEYNMDESKKPPKISPVYSQNRSQSGRTQQRSGGGRNLEFDKYRQWIIVAQSCQHRAVDLILGKFAYDSGTYEIDLDKIKNLTDDLMQQVMDLSVEYYKKQAK